MSMPAKLRDKSSSGVVLELSRGSDPEIRSDRNAWETLRKVARTISSRLRLPSEGVWIVFVPLQPDRKQRWDVVIRVPRGHASRSTLSARSVMEMLDPDGIKIHDVIFDDAKGTIGVKLFLEREISVRSMTSEELYSKSVAPRERSPKPRRRAKERRKKEPESSLFTKVTQFFDAL